MSNHTLRYLGDPVGGSRSSSIINAFLVFNRIEDKHWVAMQKILNAHSHFDMQPFFEWEFKVMPIMIEWFTKASSYTAEYDEKINKMKLSVMYDFIREFPMLCIDPVTRKEIAECTALEEELQGDELEMIRQRKARAVRRL